MAVRSRHRRRGLTFHVAQQLSARSVPKMRDHVGGGIGQQAASHAKYSPRSIFKSDICCVRRERNSDDCDHRRWFEQRPRGRLAEGQMHICAMNKKKQRGESRTSFFGEHLRDAQVRNRLVRVSARLLPSEIEGGELLPVSEQW